MPNIKMKNIILSYGLTLASWLTNVVQENPIAQWIAFAFSIIASIASVLLTGIKFYSWLKEALKDGKITDDELKEGEEILSELKGENKDDEDGSEGTAGGNDGAH